MPKVEKPVPQAQFPAGPGRQRRVPLLATIRLSALISGMGVPGEKSNSQRLPVFPASSAPRTQTVSEDARPRSRERQEIDSRSGWGADGVRALSCQNP